ncbi:HNH endonuclease [Falsochrobactrum sp. TDYN1]|uniref:HNH endonuclease n=1 Tax=Falsochrobactrum tianjinense TaxID=2706015 RepID=A0A949PNK0_9HYPH|nr:HNH endonuclease signature motif containing protein [Falsochrobactrum sp. TDYN1]MBV2144413.1 HNH endonuclease [Falsochrobactrum sp. TDYN1]
MSVRAPSICGYCNKAHTRKEPCITVQRLEKERKARFDKKRPTSRQRGYTAEWDRERKAFLAVYSSCRRCGAPATLVDHIKPHKGNQTLFWNRANWQPLCTPCHSSAKQSEERRNHEG